MSVDTATHLTGAEWDELVLGRESERTSAHLDACPECRSVADRLSLDESPARLLRSLSGPARWPWIVLSVAAVAAAGGYAYAFLATRGERDRLLSENVHLETELARHRAELDAVKRLQTPTVSSDSQNSADTEALRDALRRFQLQSTQLAEQRKAVEDLRAGYGELVQRAKGDQDRLAALSAGYEANLKEKQEALAKLQDELRDTKAQLAKADPKKSFIVVSEAFRQLAEAAGESSITLADKNATTNRQRGVVTITMTPERLEKMRHILETQSDPTLSFGWCKKGDRGCLKSRQKCENSGECVGMRVVEYVQAESANLE